MLTANKEYPKVWLYLQNIPDSRLQHIARIKLLSEVPDTEVAQECQDMNWGVFKPLLTDALIDHLHPIQVRYEEIISDTAYLDKVLAEGARKAADIADVTLNNVYQAMGFLQR
ncbi:unnamed protein product [Ilex paraguariensis]|uniref:Tryptophanyl-tRNA synthetase n=1 Tax=Ilex paraguariensis TaxID=185542 RepID=A0ABC8SSD9_9AQUA